MSTAEAWENEDNGESQEEKGDIEKEGMGDAFAEERKGEEPWAGRECFHSLIY
jgi:hypothetical protein